MNLKITFFEVMVRVLYRYYITPLVNKCSRMPTWHHPDFEGQGYDDYENPKKLLLDHTLG